MVGLLILPAALAAVPLVLEAPPGCPGAADVQRWIAERLPPGFAPQAAEVHIHVAADASGFHAEVIHATGGRRDLVAATCPDVLQAAAFSIAVALEPLDSAPPAEAAPPAAVVEAAKDVDTRQVAPEGSARSDSAFQTIDRATLEGTPPALAPQLRLESLVAVGQGPAPGPGLRAAAGLAGPTWEASLGALWLAPTQTPFGEGTVSADLLAGEISGCWVLDVVGVCGLGLVGRQHGAGHGFAENTTHDALHLAGGLRVDLRAPLTEDAAGAWQGRLAVEGWAQSAVSRLEVGGQTAWRGDALALHVVLGLAWRPVW